MTLLQIVGVIAISVILVIEVTLFFLELLDRRRDRAERAAARADREAFQHDYERFMRGHTTAPRP